MFRKKGHIRIVRRSRRPVWTPEPAETAVLEAAAVTSASPSKRRTGNVLAEYPIGMAMENAEWEDIMKNMMTMNRHRFRKNRSNCNLTSIRPVLVFHDRGTPVSVWLEIGIPSSENPIKGYILSLRARTRDDIGDETDSLRFHFLSLNWWNGRIHLTESVWEGMQPAAEELLRQLQAVDGRLRFRFSE